MHLQLQQLAPPMCQTCAKAWLFCGQPPRPVGCSLQLLWQVLQGLPLGLFPMRARQSMATMGLQQVDAYRVHRLKQRADACRHRCPTMPELKKEVHGCTGMFWLVQACAGCLP